MTTTDRQTATTFLIATFLTGIVAGVYLAVRGYDEDGLSVVLRYSGRIAFAILILVFAARPLQQLLRKPWTAKLLRNRRQLGVAFAGIHTAHFGLIMMRVRESAEMSFDTIVNPFATMVYLVIFAMLVTSFSAPARKIGRKAWKALHKTGLYVLFASFSVTQVPRSPDELELANGVLIVLAGAALATRIAAFVSRRK